jgi:hypothetical protein
MQHMPQESPQAAHGVRLPCERVPSAWRPFREPTNDCRPFGGGVNYRSLSSSLSSGYGFGDWFQIPGMATGFSAKPGGRPWLLRETLEPTRARHRMLPRSSTAFEGVRHAPHPQDPPHGPCHLTLEGRIPRSYPATIPTREITPDRFGCREPNVRALADLLA